MSLLRSDRQSIFSTDVATVSTIEPLQFDSDVVAATTISTVNLQADQITEQTVTATTSANVTTLNSTVLSCTSSNVTNANFVNPPTCSQVPTLAEQLVNKLYVDNAVPAGGGSVEEVSGTDPISPTINTTLLTGTTHTLPPGTTVGTIKTIVNGNNNAITRVPNFNVDVFAQQTVIYAQLHDPVTNRIYVAGQFPNVNNVANTANIAYLDLTNNTWNAVGTGVTLTSNTTIYQLLLKGTRLYISGNFTSVYQTSGLDNSAYAAYYEFDPVKTIGWKALVPTANKPNSNITGTVTLIRAFPNIPLLANTVFFFGDSADFRYNNTTTSQSKVIRFDESVDSSVSNPFARLQNTVQTIPQTVSDMIAVNNTLYLFGNMYIDNAPIPTDNGIVTWNITTQTLGGYNDANNQLDRFTTSIVPYTWNNVNGYVLLGGFSTYAGQPLENIAFIPSLDDPANIQFQQFPAVVSTNFGTLPLGVASVFPPSTSLFKDNEGTLWIVTNTNGSFYAVNTSPVPSLAQNTVVIGASFGPVYYDATLQRWRVLTTTYFPISMTTTNDPKKLWFGTLLRSSSGNVLNQNAGGIVSLSSMLIQLDKTLLQEVSGPFVSNTIARQKFTFVFKGQTLTFINVDNTRWVLIDASGNLVNPTSQRQLSGVVFFS